MNSGTLVVSSESTEFMDGDILEGNFQLTIKIDLTPYAPGDDASAVQTSIFTKCQESDLLYTTIKYCLGKGVCQVSVNFNSMLKEYWSQCNFVIEQTYQKFIIGVEIKQVGSIIFSSICILCATTCVDRIFGFSTQFSPPIKQTTYINVRCPEHNAAQWMDNRHGLDCEIRVLDLSVQSIILDIVNKPVSGSSFITFKLCFKVPFVIILWLRTPVEKL